MKTVYVEHSLSNKKIVQKGAYNISDCQGSLGGEGLEAGEEDTGGTTAATRSLQEGLL